MKLAAVAVLAVTLAGCGSSSSAGGAGRATLWVTRDRGAHVLHVARVAAGTSALQALDRVADVKTRFGGRYVRAVDGVEEHGNRAWFYYVNGYLADRSAAEYRLHRGDVEWWDFRSWRDPAQDPVIVGAFPEPFLHGYDGKRRPAVVVTLDPKWGRTVARRLHARLATAGSSVPRGANVLFVGPPGSARVEIAFRKGESSAGSPVRMLFLGDSRRLLDPRPFRLRYEVRP